MPTTTTTTIENHTCAYIYKTFFFFFFQETTFMNVLMGKVTRTGGTLRINTIQAEMHEFQKIIGYVPQEDIMHRELTVRENLLYSARIRLPYRNWNHKGEIEEHVDRVIEALGLGHVRHVPIGDELTRGVSGGQRKRVNIGMELVASKLVFFLFPVSFFFSVVVYFKNSSTLFPHF
jgi:ABC-type multidrug transport system ATPase subunit